ncbi:uncharacterized protein LOC144877414 [Branchiostoma floridae x Branchiostoma japonicum]
MAYLVRGRKDGFSAAPSSDGIDAGLCRSYQKYIQTAGRDLENGDLDAAEQNLAAALKLVHDRYKPDKAREADCLSRLGDVYVERGKRTGEGRTFTQAAALYNASMARTDGDKQNMVTRLQETERQFLRNTCNLDCEPCPYSSALDHIKELDNMRARVKSQLDTIHQEHNPYQYDEDDPVVREVEIKRAEAIKNLFKGITVDRQEFIQALTDECIAKLGPPPCKYAFIGLGSQATELVTPYSDLEFAILIEEGKDDDDTRRYFQNLTHYLHLKVINLGETILPAMAIPSLNDFLSEDPEKDWFFDSVTPRGFAFDGFMPWASKTPFGRDETKSKPPVSLIQTPEKLSEYQHLRIALAEGYHLSDILRRVTYLTGDESLVDDYADTVNRGLDRSPLLTRLSAELRPKDHNRQKRNSEPTGLLDVKKEIYRFPSLSIDVLSICSGITIPSVWGIIKELQRTQRISQEDAHHLTVLISISAELRLRTYIANGGQKERLSALNKVKVPLDEDDTFVESVFYIPDSKMLYRYYYTAIPLKSWIANTVEKINQKTKMFPTNIFDASSLTRGRITWELFQFDASMCHFKAALTELATTDDTKRLEILVNLGNVSQRRGDCKTAKNYYERALRIGNAIYGDNKAHLIFAAIIENIGTCWSQLGDQRKALTYQEQALILTKAIYGERAAHPDIATNLHLIGICWSDLDDQRKALIHLEQSLKMRKAIYGEHGVHPDIASSLNRIGNCWNRLGDQKKAIRYYKQSLQMRKVIYGVTTAHPAIAISLNNIGVCCGKLGDQTKAMGYFEQSLKIEKSVHGAKHPEIASSLGNIGSCWSSLGDKMKAISYYEQSLKMQKAVYGETAEHPDIATSLDNIGSCWSYLSDQRKAISCHKQSLKMWKAIYGETAVHSTIASSLGNIGSCWSKLGDLKNAISYHEQSLKMEKAIYGFNTPHPAIAASLSDFGKSWSDLGNQRKAISYYEQSLKMMRALYGEGTARPDIALLLNNIGNCWYRLGSKRKAVRYHEQTFNMFKTIYGETTAHPEIASSLSNIGSCWSDLGDKKKAIGFHEESLKMLKDIYGETATHPDIASSLHNIGLCWNDLGDYRKAIGYHEQSLKMSKAIHGETTAHPDIAASLNDIGSCWSNINDQSKAIKYLKQSLKMRKAMYGETTAHPDIAVSLNNIGKCWIDLGDPGQAFSNLEQSLKMMKAIYGEGNAHPVIAASLNNIGNGLYLLGDQRKALKYYEHSLKMKKDIIGETTAHPDIALILNNIGACWKELGDPSKALSYLEQSVEIMTVLYGPAHPNVGAIQDRVLRCRGVLGI